MGCNMATLNFNLHGYSFQQGLKIIRSSYNSAKIALYTVVENAEHKLSEYERGGEWIGELDDEGHTLWEQSDILGMNVDLAKNALMVLRKSFAISIYHHWERSALVWIAKVRLEHTKLEKEVMALGYPIDQDLRKVWLLANTLKHNSKKWGEQLYDTWEELFTFNPKECKYVDWYETIQLNDYHVLQIVGIVKSSGPHEHS